MTHCNGERYTCLFMIIISQVAIHHLLVLPGYFAVHEISLKLE